MNRNVTPAFAALAGWYDSHSAVRRLWAIEGPQGIRVILALEPTPDGDDTQPAWIANSREWAHELQRRMDSSVQLELVGEPLFEGIDLDGEDVVVAELCWRDPSAM